MRGVPGTTCRLRVDFFDHDQGVAGPEDLVGDFFRTDAGSCYRIDEWRPAREGSRSLGTYICTRLERGAVEFGDPGVWRWEFSRRERPVPA